MSVNHQFIELSELAVKRYTKTVPYIVSGKRLNPHNKTAKMDFTLKTHSKDFDFETKKAKSFDYEHEVVELYSEDEVRFFIRMNRYLLDQGLIKEYFGTNPSQANLDNFLSDEEIKEIAASRTPPILKKKIHTITSTVTLERIKAAAIILNRTIGMIAILDNKIHDLVNIQ